MEKLCGNSMIYNPYKRKAWAYLSLLFSFTIAMAYGLLTSQYSLTEVLILILLAIIDAISTYLVLRDLAYSTTIIINSNGISVTFSGKDSPIYIPWSNGVYINIRLENDYPGYKQLIRNRVLCLSNKDADGDFVLYDNSINVLHKLPVPDDEPWVIFLYVSSTSKCEKEAERVLAFKEEALAKR